MIISSPGSYAVDTRACIRCAACATVAPDNFLVKAGPAKVRRHPQNAVEGSACEAARVICPTQAISVSHAAAAADPSIPAIPAELYSPVMEVAEGVRWRVEDMP